MALLWILSLPCLMVTASRETSMAASLIKLEKTSLHEGLNTMVLRAREWLNLHGGEDPDQAGMEELRSTNPDAYAIVQALMTKKVSWTAESKASYCL